MADSVAALCTARGVRVGLIGAGAVNFGSTIGPWDHASRLEKIEQLQIVAICDPIAGKAESVLAERKSRSPTSSVYSQCKTYEDYRLMLSQEKLDAVFIGVPPFAHGCFEQPIELECVRQGVHCFIEKPLSVQAVHDVSDYMEAVVAAQVEKQVVVSVGYMFRYHTAIRRMKSLLKEHEEDTGSKLKYLQLTYKTAYSHSTNWNWWRKERSGGPIVEQATHFCDIARFIGGSIRNESIMVNVLCDDDPSGAGQLHAVPSAVAEDEIASSQRVPRVTCAQWRFERGAIGQLTHGVFLHGRKYESGIEAWADGLRVAITSPYTSECCLSYRRGDTDDEIVEKYGDCDPYLDEDKAFIDAVLAGNSDLIESSYQDAIQTYRFSWAIRSASELTQATTSSVELQAAAH